MKTLTALVSLVLLQTVCEATSYIRIRLEHQDSAQQIILNDRPIAIEKFADIMDKLARIDTNQFIMVQISQSTRASQLIDTLEILRFRGFKNVAVYPLDGVSSITSTNQYSFTLIPNENVDTKEFEKQLQKLDEIPATEMNGEQSGGAYGSPAAGSPSAHP